MAVAVSAETLLDAGILPALEALLPPESRVPSLEAHAQVCV